MAKKTQQTIVLNVHGGVVQDVFSSDPNIKVILVDWDTEGCEDGVPHLVTVDEQEGGNERAWVSELTAEPLEDLADTDVERAMNAARAAGWLDGS